MIKGKVSIVITTFVPENKHYLDLCIKAIHNLNYPKELLEVILVGKKSYQPTYDGVTTVAPDHDDFYNSYGLNYGFERMDRDSQYFFVMNDDAILTKNSIQNMVRALGDQKVFLNALSPCDNYLFYSMLMGYVKDGQHKILPNKHYVYDDIKDDIPELLDAESFYPPGLIKVPFHCIYATLIPMHAYLTLGPWDINFKTGQDDIDYCMRADQIGYSHYVATNALIWHFGGVSVNTGTLTTELRKANIEYFHKKWGKYPPGMSKQFVDAM